MILSSAATAATPSGMPMPRLTTLFGLQLERGAAGDDLALVIGIGGERVERHADLAGERRRCRRSAKVCMWFSGFGDDDAVDQRRRGSSPGAG